MNFIARLLATSALFGATALAGCSEGGENAAAPPATEESAPESSMPEAAAPEAVSEPAMIERGRYLAIVGGCNDCHTDGWAQNGGTTPDADWLVGSAIGYMGPWGTTYPVNLRLRVTEISEDDWVNTLKTRTTSQPMPWQNVNKMPQDDLRAIYRFVASLGPKGEPAPPALGPDVVPETPYIFFVPIVGAPPAPAPAPAP